MYSMPGYHTCERKVMRDNELLWFSAARPVKVRDYQKYTLRLPTICLLVGNSPNKVLTKERDVAKYLFMNKQ